MDEKTILSEFNKIKRNKLIASIILDAVGMATFLLPGIAEFADMVWAPIAAVANFMMYRGLTGAMGGFTTFVEELLPMTDWVPSFTLTWIFKYKVRRKAALKEFVRKKGSESLEIKEMLQKLGTKGLKAETH